MISFTPERAAEAGQRTKGHLLRSWLGLGGRTPPPIQDLHLECWECGSRGSRGSHQSSVESLLEFSAALGNRTQCVPPVAFWAIPGKPALAPLALASPTFAEANQPVSVSDSASALVSASDLMVSPSVLPVAMPQCSTWQSLS